jgi:cytochrome c-type biogenesis protein CcmH
VRRAVVGLWAALAFGLAGTAPLPAEQEARAHRLAQSLRCPVCQNQTVAESSAPLAQDLREQIQAQVAAGRSDDEVRAFMVQRFGDFVLYEPPRTRQTLLLWLGPFLLLGGGALALRRRLGPGHPVTEPEVEAAPDRATGQAGEGA